MTKNLHLRPLEKSDLEFMHNMRVNSDVMDYWFEEPYTTLEKMNTMYENSQDNDSHRQFILYQNDERIGYVGLFDIETRHRNAEFGIMIAPEHQGKGYAADATRLTVEYGFNKVNLRKLYLYVDEVNEKAVHIYKKLGFQVDGTLREHYFVNGEYHDAYVMSLLRKDYTFGQ
ncbi:GNAT family N-acetyltransferase [Allobacillus sp. GCM10007491]|uniref:GNAT family N-acetyltransferase n=1 Tax=Allobacillus saliphilus TaxID=2912308 RepID=A0A941CU34_9BACI|nr:GNAT family N-acetyltransferase [Allobacillus saliphilus]MBR7552586.1 GNAT family N-acetyltransferase [Allobacillus saliphilus]